VKSLVTEERRALIGQLVRFGLTGVLATLVNIVVYQIAAARFGIDPNLAWAIGYVAAVLVGYVTHSRFSFRGHGVRDNLARTGGRFIIVSLISFALNSFWVWLLVQSLVLPLWAPYPLILGLTPLITFTLNRKWVFG
jgi:putative flippase GtrA